MLPTLMRSLQELERPVPRHVDALPSRAPLQPHPTNLHVGPSAAQVMAGKPVPCPSGPSSSVAPLSQVPGQTQVG